MSEWLARADWSKRSAELGAVSVHGHPVMTFTAASPAIWDLWARLPAHPNILAVVERGLLRYAALDWHHVPPPERLATTGVVLVRVYESVVERTDLDLTAWLASPVIKFDLEGVVRVAFATATGSRREALPPEVFDRWPRCDEPGLAFVIGHAIRALGSTPAVDAVVARCLEHDPSRRPQTLGELRAALTDAGARHIPPARQRASRPVWELLERGLGYLAVGDPTEALVAFERALAIDPRSQHARELRDEARARGVDPLFADVIEGVPDDAAVVELGDAILPHWPPRSFASRNGRKVPVWPAHVTWAEAELVGRELERERDFTTALALYRKVADELVPIAHVVALARCYLQLGDDTRALACADQVRGVAPDHAEAFELAVAARLRGLDHVGALAAVDGWLADHPDDTRAHHLRGKALLALGRPAEARAAFDRAATELLEAMLLRQELDRSSAKLRSTVGAAIPVTIAVPEHLAALREPLAAGRIDAAVALLQDHERDPVARLLLGELLVFAGRPHDALAAFDAVLGLGDQHRAAAMLGKARVLLVLDRPAEALSLFESLAEVGEALDGRARALRRLGRDADADAALDRYIALTARARSARDPGGRT